jgi:hypothetical protein
MSRGLEIDIELRVVDWAWKVHKIQTLKLNLQGNRGYPDRIFLLPLRPAWIEFKRYGKTARRLQSYRIAELIGIGYDAIATDNATEAIDWLSRLHTARLSEAGYSASDIASMRRTSIASWLREDKHNTRRISNPEKE